MKMNSPMSMDAKEYKAAILAELKEMFPHIKWTCRIERDKPWNEDGEYSGAANQQHNIDRPPKARIKITGTVETMNARATATPYYDGVTIDHEAAVDTWDGQ